MVRVNGLSACKRRQQRKQGLPRTFDRRCTGSSSVALALAGFAVRTKRVVTTTLVRALHGEVATRSKNDSTEKKKEEKH